MRELPRMYMQELTVGEIAPDFIAKITDGNTIKLSEILSAGELSLIHI